MLFCCAYGQAISTLENQITNSMSPTFTLIFMLATVQNLLKTSYILTTKLDIGYVKISKVCGFEESLALFEQFYYRCIGCN